MPPNTYSLPPLKPDPTGDFAQYSRFVQRIRRRYADLLPLLPPGLPSMQTMQRVLLQLRAEGKLDAASSLRVLRSLVQERLIVLDCDHEAPLSAIVQTLTSLAELALQDACAQAAQELDARHGAPRKADGSACALWVMGMGKLGARELNASSDIDLIYVYEAEGETLGNAQGRNAISHHEYFAKMVRAISTYLADSTEHGYVFRVDLALRPNGNSGPAAVSLAALEEYFLVQGREWERFAWLKSRAVAVWPPAAGGRAAEKTRAQALADTVLPFVFRKRLDYGVFESLRVLHGQIRSHAASRERSKGAQECDVKLGRGGIREIEFTVQLLQVVRGGQFPELRVRATLDALEKLVQAQLMPRATAEKLAAAYDFLRRVEHRTQYLDDLQTHTLPRNPADVDWIARSMGFADATGFFAALEAHRQTVEGEFDHLLGAAPQAGNGSADALDWDSIVALYHTDAAAPEPNALVTRMTQLRDGPKLALLRDSGRQRVMRLAERIGHWLQEGKTEPDAVLRFYDWLEHLLRRENYLALLLERPSVLGRLLRLLGSARWPARYVQRHPGVIDELAHAGMLTERFAPEQLLRELEQRRAALQAAGEDDEENLLNMLRRAHHAEVFRTLARDVEGHITVEQVADDLSLLADTMLDITCQWCWQRLKNRHRPLPQIGIIAYGKLGGKELGYGSDLDIVFVYDDEDDNASEVYAAFVRKLITWMTTKTAEGDLFEIDMALRPNGSSGLLVTRFAAYADYQQQRGSNTAWVWEHQAMTRARFVQGSSAMRAQFDAVRHAVLAAPRDHAALAQEITSMREKMAQAHPVPAGYFDVKHSAGGMVDAEFAVQYLVLAHSGTHESLLPNVGNIALMHRAQAAGLVPAGVGQAAADAYRVLRRYQHKARLDEQPTRVPASELAAPQAAIEAFWLAVFGSARGTARV